LQNHHTWRPGYAQFQGTNHIGLMESMRTSHITDRGWQDIGQNLTIFPDGQIGLCRAIDVKRPEFSVQMRAPYAWNIWEILMRGVM
jgi:hypothetical protein